MSEVRTFFRHCPACGRRFQIRLVTKKLVNLERETTKMTTVIPVGPYLSRGAGAPLVPLVLEENLPVTVDIEEFQYTYKCKACGHEWNEKHVEEKKEA
ncbi:MAG: hypothetical protein OK422_05820 [Thaumarchaeota archaeon]|nr:hypothetical protein [Nitrososphaerota archaeon]